VTGRLLAQRIAAMALDHCMEVFARGLAFTRSFSRPYLAAKAEGMGWWLREAPETRGKRRNDEWIVAGSSAPTAVDRRVRRCSLGGRLINVVCPVAGEKETCRATYRELGYRLWRTEWLMRRATVKNAIAVDTGVEIAMVDGEEMALRLAEAARGRLLLPSHLQQRPRPVRCHVALVEGAIRGWARSVAVDRSAWFASLFVLPEFRRRGLGGALLAATLRADETAGLSDSVLVASHAGAGLYAKAGYETVAAVFVFSPSRR
jgi:GNAT superfamily N-acetyltransferase